MKRTAIGTQIYEHPDEMDTDELILTCGKSKVICTVDVVHQENYKAAHKEAILYAAAPELLSACKHALRLAEDPNLYPATEAIKMKALLVSELMTAMRKAGISYKDMTDASAEGVVEPK